VTRLSWSLSAEDSHSRGFVSYGSFNPDMMFQESVRFKYDKLITDEPEPDIDPEMEIQLTAVGLLALVAFEGFFSIAQSHLMLMTRLVV